MLFCTWRKLLALFQMEIFIDTKKAAGLAHTDGLNGLIKHINDCIKKFFSRLASEKIKILAIPCNKKSQDIAVILLLG